MANQLQILGRPVSKVDEYARARDGMMTAPIREVDRYTGPKTQGEGLNRLAKSVGNRILESAMLPGRALKGEAIPERKVTNMAVDAFIGAGAFSAPRGALRQGARRIDNDGIAADDALSYVDWYDDLLGSLKEVEPPVELDDGVEQANEDVRVQEAEANEEAEPEVAEEEKEGYSIADAMPRLLEYLRGDDGKATE